MYQVSIICPYCRSKNEQKLSVEVDENTRFSQFVRFPICEGKRCKAPWDGQIWRWGYLLSESNLEGGGKNRVQIHKK